MTNFYIKLEKMHSSTVYFERLAHSHTLEKILHNFRNNQSRIRKYVYKFDFTNILQHLQYGAFFSPPQGAKYIFLARAGVKFDNIYH